MVGTEEAVDEGDDGLIGEFHEGFEDAVEELEGLALVQGAACLVEGPSPGSRGDLSGD
jgi:hypothetical protein